MTTELWGEKPREPRELTGAELARADEAVERCVRHLERELQKEPQKRDLEKEAEEKNKEQKKETQRRKGNKEKKASRLVPDSFCSDSDNILIMFSY